VSVKPENADYILGYSKKEHARLERQAVLLEPATQNALHKVSVEKGWRCLDVACGTGSVTRILGDMVGQNGAVHAVDLDEVYGSVAVKTLKTSGVSNFSFEKLDVTGQATPLGAPFDLVYTRLLILHMADQLKVLKNLWSWVKPGGVLLVEDYDMLPASTFTDGGRASEAGPLIRKIFGALGKDFRAGSTMPRKFLQAGIGHVDGYAFSATFVSASENIERTIPVLQSLIPVALKFDLVRKGEIEELITAMEAEKLEPYGTGRWPDLVSIWKRKPI
jgi:ubiquinone/menaquinone biosynthesis C-methylase UbiE